MRAIVFGLFAAAFVIVSAQTAGAANRVALVIGNDDYGEVADLQKAVNDARAMAETLNAVGFEVLEAENVTRREMNRQLQLFASKLGAGDEALFFFAGHGVQIDGRNFLLPTDIPSAKPGQEAFVTTESIAVDQVLDRIRSRGTRVSVLVLDACRNNPFPKSGTRALGGTRGLARMPAPEGTFIMFSAGEGQTALDRLSDEDPHPNSVFTRSLIPLIKRPGMSLVQTARQVRRDVQQLAAAVPHEQRPAYYDEVTGDFFFAGPKTAGATPPPPPPATPSAAAVETAFWRAVEATGRREGFEQYLQRYPDGVFAEAAKVWLKSFEPKETEVAALDTAVATDTHGTDVVKSDVPPILDCDKLAADPDDPGRVTVGVKYEEIATKRAIAACREAYREYPKSPRITYQLARSLNRDGQHDEARQLFEAMADDGYAPAMDQFGVMLALGKGGGTDYARAMRLFEGAADQGSGAGLYHIGLLYHNGFGVRRDHAKAAEYYERAIAKSDYPSALSNLGTLYARGLGVGKDERRAAELYRRAADQGHVIAMNNLATAYRDGVGVTRDYAKAIEYFKKSAEDGGSSAMYGLAVIYHQGQGTRRDMRQSADWMYQALKSGYDLAVKEMVSNARAWSDQFRRELQTRMRDEGAYTGAIDGQFGPGTQRAIRALADAQG